MNPIYAWIAAHLTAKRLLRTCPACGNRQAVSREKILDTVQCERCGKPVPPQKERGK